MPPRVIAYPRIAPQTGCVKHSELTLSQPAKAGGEVLFYEDGSISLNHRSPELYDIPGPQQVAVARGLFEALGYRIREQELVPFPALVTFEDLMKLIREGKVKPQAYRIGEYQVADLFAGTGLSTEERKKVLMRSYPHPAGTRMYVHRGCAEQYLRRIAEQGQVVFVPDTEEWTAQDLIGRYQDVTHCDECGRFFDLADDRYLSYWITNPDQMRLWEEVQAERRTESPT